METEKQSLTSLCFLPNLILQGFPSLLFQLSPCHFKSLRKALPQHFIRSIIIVPPFTWQRDDQYAGKTDEEQENKEAQRGTSKAALYTRDIFPLGIKHSGLYVQEVLSRCVVAYWCAPEGPQVCHCLWFGAFWSKITELAFQVLQLGF